MARAAWGRMELRRKDGWSNSAPAVPVAAGDPSRSPDMRRQCQAWYCTVRSGVVVTARTVATAVLLRCQTARR